MISFLEYFAGAVLSSLWNGLLYSAPPLPSPQTLTHSFSLLTLTPPSTFTLSIILSGKASLTLKLG